MIAAAVHGNLKDSVGMMSTPTITLEKVPFECRRRSAAAIHLRGTGESLS
jgi:hypothetical protein